MILLLIIAIFVFGTAGVTKYFCHAESKKNWHNTRFMNLALPTLGTLIILMCTGAAMYCSVIDNKDCLAFFALLDIVLIVLWKSTWLNLERLSLRQREHYGLVGYPGNLTDLNDAECRQLAQQWQKK